MIILLLLQSYKSKEESEETWQELISSVVQSAGAN